MVKFDFTTAYHFEDEVVRLSPLTMDHMEELQTQSNEDSIWTYFLEKGQGIENFTKYIIRALEAKKASKEYPFVVFDKTSKQYVGMTRLYEWNKNLGTIKLGHTWYGKVFQGTGINKRTKFLLFEFVFEQLEVVRVGFGVHGGNIRSLMALRSIGVQKEGILRDFLPQLNGTGRTDLILLSLLQVEWFQKVKKELHLKINPNEKAFTQIRDKKPFVQKNHKPT